MSVKPTIEFFHFVTFFLRMEFLLTFLHNAYI